MVYSLLTMDDGTEIVYSHMLPDGKIKVYVERPDEIDCFHYATCWLPGCKWENIFGFTQEEIDAFQSVINTHLHSLGYDK